MKHFKWSDTYSVGVEEIDRQHRQLFEIINQFHESFGEGDQKATKKLLVNLLEYALVHFKTEEHYFSKFNYEASDFHIRQHVEFESTIIEFQKNFQLKRTFSASEISEFLKKWIINHVLITDKKYMHCFNENGLK